MLIKLTSLLVDDQEKAVRFYTEVIGFEKKVDIPVGEFRWVTVVAPEGKNDLELVLEPNANPAGKTFQKALFDQGIPATSFESQDIEAEVARLKKAGVAFTRGPMRVGAVTVAVFADTCGNLIQIHQPA